MTHRFSRRGHGRRTNLFHQILVLAATRPVFTADYYAVDGVTGKVASFIDWNDATHLLAQSSSLLQVALPAAHADYAGKLCATFTGAERYVSNRAGASWNYLSNGTSMSVHAVCTPTATNTRLCSTRNAGNGFLLGIQAGPSWLAYIQGGPSPGVARPLNLASMWSFRFTDGGGSPEYTDKITGFSAVTGDATTPTASGLTLTLGANPDGTLGYVGRIAFLGFGPDMGTSGTGQMQSCLTALYGVAA